MVRSCGQIPATVTSVNVIVAERSQLSVAVAVPVFAGSVLAVHNTVTFTGQVICGGVLSSTKMVCVQVAELPQSSVPTQVLEIVYSCGQPPPVVISLNVNATTGSQLSVPVAVPVVGGSVLELH